MNKLTFDILLDICATVCEVETQKIISRDRSREFVTARQVFCYHAINTMKSRFTEVAKFLDRDHTTIIYSERTAKDRKFIDDKTFVPFFDKVGNILFEDYGSNTISLVFTDGEERERFLTIAKENNWNVL
jgi:hypothetical protein